MKKLTELEKSIIMAFSILTKGSTEKYLKQDEIVMKFPRQQRKAVRNSLEGLVATRSLFKDPKESSYRLTENGLGESKKILSGGFTLRL